MRAVQTLAAQRVAVANAKDLKLPAISVARPTLYLSSLRLVGPCCVANVSAQVVPHSRGPEFSQASWRLAGITATTMLQTRHSCVCWLSELPREDEGGFSICHSRIQLGSNKLCVLDFAPAGRDGYSPNITLLGSRSEGDPP